MSTATNLQCKMNKKTLKHFNGVNAQLTPFNKNNALIFSHRFQRISQCAIFLSSSLQTQSIKLHCILYSTQVSSLCDLKFCTGHTFSSHLWHLTRNTPASIALPPQQLVQRSLGHMMWMALCLLIRWTVWQSLPAQPQRVSLEIPSGWEGSFSEISTDTGGELNHSPLRCRQNGKKMSCTIFWSCVVPNQGIWKVHTPYVFIVVPRCCWSCDLALFPFFLGIPDTPWDGRAIICLVNRQTHWNHVCVHPPHKEEFTFTNPAYGSSLRLFAELIGPCSRKALYVGAYRATRKYLFLQQVQQKAWACIKVVHIHMLAFTQKRQILEAYHIIITQSFTCGQRRLTFINEEVPCVATCRISKNEDFVAPLGWLVLHVLFEADCRFRSHHPFVRRQLSVWMEVRFACCYDVSGQRLDFEKSVIVWSPLFLRILSILFKIAKMQVPRNGLKSAPGHHWFWERRIVNCFTCPVICNSFCAEEPHVNIKCNIWI